MDFSTISSIYNMIGVCGVILVVLILYALYITIKNHIYLSIVWKQFKRDFLDLEQKECCPSQAFKKDLKNPLVNLIKEILTAHSKHSDDIRSEVAYLFHRNFEGVTKDLTYLRLVSVISPLLGLLGTVIGMVDVFQAIASSTSPDPTVLASGIWSALLTTILGLSVAIPSLMAYYFLMLKFKGFHIEAIEHSYRVLDLCSASEIK